MVRIRHSPQNLKIMKLKEFSKLADVAMKEAGDKYSLLNLIEKDDKLKEEINEAISIAQERILKEILEKIDLNQLEI